MHIGAWLKDAEARQAVADNGSKSLDMLAGALERTVAALEPYLMEFRFDRRTDMREPAFWGRPQGGGEPARARRGALRHGRRLAAGPAGAAAGIYMLCIGNLTAGGAGSADRDGGWEVVLSRAGALRARRGYGGRLPVRCRSMRWCMARPTSAASAALGARRADHRGADRFTGSAAGRAAGTNIIMIDDGFQSPSLARTFRCW